MMLRPLPLAALPDDMEVRVPVDAPYGGALEEEPRLVRHVCFQPSEGIAPSQHVFQDGSRGLVFVDAVNSGGAFEVPVGSVVSIGGREDMTVVACTPHSPFGVTHHWELEVS